MAAWQMLANASTTPDKLYLFVASPQRWPFCETVHDRGFMHEKSYIVILRHWSLVSYSGASADVPGLAVVLTLQTRPE